MIEATAAPIRVVLCDDQPVFLRGLAAVVEREDGIVAVGCAASGEDAVAQIVAARPDIAVLGLVLRDMSGVSVVSAVAEAGCEVRIVFLSAFEDRVSVDEAFRGGGTGYVLKHSPEERIVTAIRAAHEGELYLDPALPGQSLTALSGRRASSRLTEREREVVRLVALGFTNKEVAGKLGVTSKSIETYKMRAGEKLNIRSRTKLVQYALLQGWFHEALSHARGMEALHEAREMGSSEERARPDSR